LITRQLAQALVKPPNAQKLARTEVAVSEKKSVPCWWRASCYLTKGEFFVE
jgi:hypothetical protein